MCVNYLAAGGWGGTGGGCLRVWSLGAGGSLVLSGGVWGGLWGGRGYWVGGCRMGLGCERLRGGGGRYGRK